MKIKKICLKSAVFFLAIIILLAFSLCTAMQIGFDVSNKNARVFKVQYEKADIGEYLKKDVLSEADYAFLYKQTGLTKLGIDRALKHGEDGKQKILDIQNDFFGDYEITHKPFALWTGTEYIDKAITGIYLEDGDIVATASTHLSCLRIGHSGLVVDGTNKKVLQGAAYGSTSRIGDFSDFSNRTNFLVLCPKVCSQTRTLAAEYAKKNLVGIPYSAFKGTDGGQTELHASQCAHLVWYAYHKFGYDLVKNKRIIFPYDFVNADSVELVQVFGFDTERLWDKLLF